MTHLPEIIRISLLLLLFCLCASHVYGDAATPDIHQLVTEADHIVVAAIQDIETEHMKTKAKIEVAKWIKTQFKTPPKEYTIFGMLVEDSPFIALEEGKQFVLFIFDKNQLKRPFTAIEVAENGELSSYLLRGLADTPPQTLDEMVATIETIMSDAYEERLIAQIKDTTLADNLRAHAATSLGYLKSTKAFPLLLEWTKSDDLHNNSTTSAAMWSLFRIDSQKATPIFVDIAASSTVAGNVRLACHFLWLKPSKNPKDVEGILAACQRWKGTEDEGYEAFASLIRATGSMGIVTPELKALLMDQIKQGTGNVKRVSMTASGHLMIEEALPLIHDISLNDDDAKMRTSAKLALVYYNLAKERSNEE